MYILIPEFGNTKHTHILTIWTPFSNVLEM